MFNKDLLREQVSSAYWISSPGGSTINFKLNLSENGDHGSAHPEAGSAPQLLVLPVAMEYLRPKGLAILDLFLFSPIIPVGL